MDSASAKYAELSVGERGSRCLPAFGGLVMRIVLALLIVGVGAAGVVGGIHNLGNGGDGLYDRHFDPLLQSHIDHPATYAAAP